MVQRAPELTTALLTRPLSPLFAAPSVRVHLQQLSARRVSILAGDVSVREEELPGRGAAVTADLTKVAVLSPLDDSEEAEASEGASDESAACLVVLELPGQRRLCAWPLPRDSCHTAASWSWARDKLHIVLPWGWCWGRVASAPLWNYNEYEQEPDFAGISLLNTCTGAVANVELGYHEL